MKKIAHIIQSQDNWNEITIYVSDQEDWKDDQNAGIWWTTGTSHVFSPDYDETGGMEFFPDQWEADIDCCLAQMGYLRTSELTTVSDFEQTCEVAE